MNAYMPDVIKFEFFLRDGITAILKKANIMIIHRDAKSAIPIGIERALLISSLLCGITGAMNNGPTITKTNNF